MEKGLFVSQVLNNRRFWNVLNLTNQVTGSLECALFVFPVCLHTESSLSLRWDFVKTQVNQLFQLLEISHTIWLN